MPQLKFRFEEACPPAPTALSKLPSYIQDHRQRLRDRFQSGGADAVPDYELLELILFRVIRRQDVKPLARRLLDQFGDLAGVMGASDERLLETEGVGPATIQELRIVEATAHRLSRRRVTQQHVLSGWDTVIAYCRTTMAYAKVESFRVLFLDRRNALIADEELARGTIDHVPVYPREVVKRALALDATALILVHNHPSGDPTPSEADIAMTHQISDAAQALSISLYDHVIVGAGGERSFRSEGLI